MKKQHVIVLIVVAAVLALGGWFINRGPEKSWNETSSRGGSKVLELPINDVAQVTIQTAKGTTTLVKKQDTWLLQGRDYPAAFEKVSNLLRKVWDLKAVQDVKAGPSQFARLELVDPPQGSGAKLEFKDNGGKQLGLLLIGKKYMRKAEGPMGGPNEFPAGRYVMTPSNSRVSLVSEMFSEVDNAPETWLAHEFIKVENPSAITLTGTTDAQKWKLMRENATAEWKLDRAAPNEKVDQAKISSMTSTLSNMNFADVMPGSPTAAETGLDKPTMIAVDTFDHFTYMLKVGKVVGANDPVTVEVNAQLPPARTPQPNEKPEDTAKLDDEFNTKQQQLRDKLVREKKFEGRVFLVAKTTVDNIIKDRTALLAQATPAPAPVSPPGVSPSKGPPPPPPKTPPKAKP